MNKVQILTTTMKFLKPNLEYNTLDQNMSIN